MKFFTKFLAIAALAVAPLAAHAVTDLGDIDPSLFGQTGVNQQSVCLGCTGVTNFSFDYTFDVVNANGVLNVGASNSVSPTGGGTWVFSYTILRPDATELVTGTFGDNSSIPADAFIAPGTYTMNVTGSFTAIKLSSANFSMTITSAPLPTPEPGSLALLGLGLVGLGAAARRRKV